MDYICSDCPRRCGAHRSDETAAGFCRSPALPTVVRAAPHYGEEPCISGTRGSGAVFFSVSHEIPVPVSVFAGQVQLHGSFGQMIQIVLNFSQGKHDGRAEPQLPAHSFLQQAVDFCEILKTLPGLIPVQANKRQKNSFGDDAVLLKKISGVLIQGNCGRPGGDAGKKHPVQEPHFMDPVQKPYKAPVDKALIY